MKDASEFEIYELAVADAPRIGMMMVEFMEEVAPNMSRKPLADEYSEAMVSILHRNGKVFGAKIQPHGLVGFACATENVSLISAGPHIELTELYIVPAFRNRGLGSRLLDRVEKLCVERGHRRVLICTGESNLSSPPNSLYVRRGFEYLGPNLRKLV